MSPLRLRVHCDLLAVGVTMFHPILCARLGQHVVVRLFDTRLDALLANCTKGCDATVGVPDMPLGMVSVAGLRCASVWSCACRRVSTIFAHRERRVEM